MGVGRFSGRTAVVTGASAGIGAAIARRLILEGANVVAGAREEAGLAALRDELGDRLLPVAMDVTVESDTARIVHEAVARFGRLDLAVNNAGGGHRAGIVSGSGEDWRATIEQSLTSVFFCIQHQAKQMIAQGQGGAILNISSVNAVIPVAGSAAYPAAKGGLEQLTRSSALELARYGIRVNSLLPGLVTTRATERLREDHLDEFNTRIAMGRPAAPDEIAGPAAFLLSDDASYVTGSSLVVDGGWLLTGYVDLT